MKSEQKRPFASFILIILMVILIFTVTSYSDVMVNGRRTRYGKVIAANSSVIDFDERCKGSFENFFNWDSVSIVHFNNLCHPDKKQDPWKPGVPCLVPYGDEEPTFTILFENGSASVAKDIEITRMGQVTLVLFFEDRKICGDVNEIDRIKRCQHSKRLFRSGNVKNKYPDSYNDCLK